MAAQSPSSSPQDGADGSGGGGSSDNLVFQAPQAVREDYIQNAVKFLAHPKVKGSPVSYRYSFLEKKGLTKDEIEEAFRRVPDPQPNSTDATAVVSQQASNPNQSAVVQPYTSVQSPLATTGSVTTGHIVPQTRTQFSWFHTVLGAGIFLGFGASSVVIIKNVFLPRLKSWTRRVVSEGDENADNELKSKLYDEIKKSMEASSSAFSAIAKTNQELLASKDEDKKILVKLTEALDSQAEVLKSLSEALNQTRENRFSQYNMLEEHVQPGPWNGPTTNSWRASQQTNMYNMTPNGDFDSGRQSFLPLPAEPTSGSFPRSYVEEIWKCDNIPPRVQVFGWRLLRGALATGMRAGARSKHIDPTCSRCGKKEDDFHLFFDCKFSQAVWFASPLGLRVEGLNHMENTQIQDIIHYILVSSKNKDTLKIVLSILWSIWKARNDLLFNKINCSPLQVLFKAKAIQLEKEEAQTRKDRKVRSCQTTSDWSRSESGLNIYTDAAWKDGDHSLKAGIGIYLDWNREDHKAIYIQASSSATSVLQAEAQAMEVAAQIAKKLKIKKPNFLTDNSILAQTLKLQDLKKNPGHWMIRPNLQQFIYHAQGMQASIHKIKRENNKEAHGLAKEAFRDHSIETCFFNCTKHPSDLCPVIAVFSNQNQNVHPGTLLSVKCQ